LHKRIFADLHKRIFADLHKRIFADLHKRIFADLHKNIVVKAMGKISIMIPDDLEKEFRDEVARRFGFRKGSMSKALEEAIRLWIEINRKNSNITHNTDRVSGDELVKCFDECKGLYFS